MYGQNSENFVNVDTKRLNIIICDLSPKQLYIIRNQEQFEKMDLTTRLCGEKTKIDFTKYTLVGYEEWGGGCGCDFEMIVKKNTKNNKVNISINSNIYGICEAIVNCREWLLIPKVDENMVIIPQN